VGKIPEQKQGAAFFFGPGVYENTGLRQLAIREA
jgi:hypothetical protein